MCGTSTSLEPGARACGLFGVGWGAGHVSRRERLPASADAASKRLGRAHALQRCNAYTPSYFAHRPAHLHARPVPCPDSWPHAGRSAAGTEALVAAARPSGRIDIYCAASGELRGSCAPPPSAGGRPAPGSGSTISCMAFLPHSAGGGDAQPSERLQLLSCTGSGLVRIHTAPALQPQPDGEQQQPQQQQGGGESGAPASWQESSSFQAGSSILCMVRRLQGLRAAGGPQTRPWLASAAVE